MVTTRLNAVKALNEAARTLGSRQWLFEVPEGMTIDEWFDVSDENAADPDNYIYGGDVMHMEDYVYFRSKHGAELRAAENWVCVSFGAVQFECFADGTLRLSMDGKEWEFTPEYPVTPLDDVIDTVAIVNEAAKHLGYQRALSACPRGLSLDAWYARVEPGGVKEYDWRSGSFYRFPDYVYFRADSGAEITAGERYVHIRLGKFWWEVTRSGAGRVGTEDGAWYVNAK
jgi:hypothetical protein